MNKPKISLIVGLGNPGNEYHETRHNAGQWLVEAIAANYQTSFRMEPKFKGQLAKIRISRPNEGCNQECLLLLPASYMNLSGQSIGAVARFYKIPPEAILIAHDELDLPPGIVRLKFAGGHGGHNGLRDAIAHLDSSNFYRLRIGIGHPGHAREVTNYVLHSPSKSDKALINAGIEKTLPQLESILMGEMGKVMNILHREN